MQSVRTANDDRTDYQDEAADVNKANNCNNKGARLIGSMPFPSPDSVPKFSFSAFLMWRRPPVSVAPRNSSPPGVRMAARPGIWQSRCGFQVSVPGEIQSARRTEPHRAVMAMTMELQNQYHLDVFQIESHETPSNKTQPPHAELCPSCADRQVQARSLTTLISERWPLEKLSPTARKRVISDHTHG